MELGIAGKTVLVTGAGRGLGSAIARGFAQEGCRLGLISRTPESLFDVLASIGGEPRHAAVCCDLMESGSTGRALSELKSKLGNFDIVVHNVGGPMGVADPLAPASEWEKVLHFNAGIAIDLNHLLVPAMQEKGWGRIIHISSSSGKRIRGKAPYAVAKGFLINYTEALGRHLAPHGIVVTCLLPGAFWYEGSYWHKIQHQEQKKMQEFLHFHQAIGRMGELSEIVPFVLFMASVHASFAPGAIFEVDGGAGGVL
jgi:3-oxoacyl-[acyl-carrier protein] reductase